MRPAAAADPRLFIRDPYNATPAVPAAGKPPKDTQVLLGYVRDQHASDDCRKTGTFFCHAIEWDKTTSRNEDGSGQAGSPAYPKFDPFRSNQFVAFQAGRTFPWMADVEDVRLVTAASRAGELGRPLSDMRAAYYYRVKLKNVTDSVIRDVSGIVPSRPGEPLHTTLQELACCPVA